eukprot:8860420-Ditylum_brightwellii.AAC.1
MANGVPKNSSSFLFWLMLGAGCLVLNTLWPVVSPGLNRAFTRATVAADHACLCPTRIASPGPIRTTSSLSASRMSSLSSSES